MQQYPNPEEKKQEQSASAESVSRGPLKDTQDFANLMQQALRAKKVDERFQDTIKKASAGELTSEQIEERAKAPAPTVTYAEAIDQQQKKIEAWEGQTDDESIKQLSADAREFLGYVLEAVETKDETAAEKAIARREAYQKLQKKMLLPKVAASLPESEPSWIGKLARNFSESARKWFMQS